jgi:hypothetical protein
MKQVIFRQDLKCCIAGNVTLKPVLCTKLSENIGAVLTKRDYYFDSRTCTFRTTNASRECGFFIVTYKNEYAFSQGEIKEEAYKKYIEMIQKQDNESIIKHWLSQELVDFTVMDDKTIKNFVSERQKEYNAKQKEKRQRRVKEQEAKEQKDREKEERYINGVIQDFISNKPISGEDLKAIIRKIKYPVNMRTVGSLRQLVQIAMKDDGCCSYSIYKGRKFTDVMSDTVRGLYDDLKEQYKTH